MGAQKSMIDMSAKNQYQYGHQKSVINMGAKKSMINISAKNQYQYGHNTGA